MLFICLFIIQWTVCSKISAEDQEKICQDYKNLDIKSENKELLGYFSEENVKKLNNLFLLQNYFTRAFIMFNQMDQLDKIYALKVLKEIKTHILRFPKNQLGIEIITQLYKSINRTIDKLYSFESFPKSSIKYKAELKTFCAQIDLNDINIDENLGKMKSLFGFRGPSMVEKLKGLNLGESILNFKKYLEFLNEYIDVWGIGNSEKPYFKDLFENFFFHLIEDIALLQIFEPKNYLTEFSNVQSKYNELVKKVVNSNTIDKPMVIERLFDEFKTNMKNINNTRQYIQDYKVKKEKELKNEMDKQKLELYEKITSLYFKRAEYKMFNEVLRGTEYYNMIFEQFRHQASFIRLYILNLKITRIDKDEISGCLNRMWSIIVFYSEYSKLPENDWRRFRYYNIYESILFSLDLLRNMQTFELNGNYFKEWLNKFNQNVQSKPDLKAFFQANLSKYYKAKHSLDTLNHSVKMLTAYLDLIEEYRKRVNVLSAGDKIFIKIHVHKIILTENQNNYLISRFIIEDPEVRNVFLSIEDIFNREKNLYDEFKDFKDPKNLKESELKNIFSQFEASKGENSFEFVKNYFEKRTKPIVERVEETEESYNIDIFDKKVNILSGKIIEENQDLNDSKDSKKSKNYKRQEQLENDKVKKIDTKKEIPFYEKYKTAIYITIAIIVVAIIAIVIVALL